MPSTPETIDLLSIEHLTFCTQKKFSWGLGSCSTWLRLKNHPSGKWAITQHPGPLVVHVGGKFEFRGNSLLLMMETLLAYGTQRDLRGKIKLNSKDAFKLNRV